MNESSVTNALIHTDRLRHNIRTIQDRLGKTELMAVVKANAYGHGHAIVSAELAASGVRHAAVATVSEAIALREAGWGGKLLVFAPPMVDMVPLYDAFELEAVVDSDDTLQLIARFGSAVPVHVKVDTGMGRYGVPASEAAAFVRQVEHTQGVWLAGLWTHFADGDAPDAVFTRLQVRRFQDVLHTLGGAPCPTHLANSGGIYTCPESIDPSLASFARVGIALYGLLDLPAAKAELAAVMECTSAVLAVRSVQAGDTISYGRTWVAPSPTVIATIGAGYADGYARCLSGTGVVSISGHEYPLVGRICMDAFMVDLGPGNPQGIRRGDTVTLFGDGPTAFDIAERSRTISYEVSCRISQRVPRIPYHSSE